MSISETGGQPNAKTTSTSDQAYDRTTTASDHVPGSTEARRDGFGLRNVLSALSVMSRLGGQAGDYLKKVEAEIESYGKNYGVKTRPLDMPSGAVAFILDRTAIVLMFEEQLSAPTRPANAPKSDNIALAAEALHAIDPALEFLEGIIVSRADYDYYPQMATHILTTLAYSNRNRSQAMGMTVQAMIENTKYTVVRDVNAARDFTRSLYPHKMLPYHNTGCVVMMKNPTQNTRNDGLSQQGTPIMAILGYTNFHEHQDPTFANSRFAPVFHTSLIISPIQHPAMAALAIAVVASEFSRNRGWLDPYQDFTSGVNIGNLINDSKGNLYNIPNRNDFNTFMNTYISQKPAIIAFDVQEGTARLPVLHNLISQHGGLHFNRLFESFFEVKAPQVRPHRSVYEEFHGYYGSPEDPKDTRELNYLKIVSQKGGKNADQLRVLMQPDNDPVQRSLELQRLGADSIRFLYRTNIAILEPEFINTIEAIFQQYRVSIHSNDTAGNSIIGYNSISDIADTLAAGSGIVQHMSPSQGTFYGQSPYSSGISS
jgi:hypothetical protein